MKRMEHGETCIQDSCEDSCEDSSAIDSNGMPAENASIAVPNEILGLRQSLAVDDARFAEVWARAERLRLSNAALTEELRVVKAELARAHHLVHHDPLTSLPNRTLLLDRLHQAISHCERQHRQCALLFLDVDDFKPINDTFGHQAGDEFLRLVAKRLRLCVRADDTVCRLGGDEFLLLLPEIRSREDAVRVAEKVLARSAEPYRVKAREINIMLSIGIAIFPDDGNDAENLLSSADSALYRAKAGGFGNGALPSRTQPERLRLLSPRNRRPFAAGGLARSVVFLQPPPDIPAERQIKGSSHHSPSIDQGARWFWLSTQRAPRTGYSWSVAPRGFDAPRACSAHNTR